MTVRDDLSLDDLLDKMPLFCEHERSMQERGIKREILRSAADPCAPFVFFKKKKDKAYGADCECYGGYYLDGVYGAVVCTKVNFLLPGVIRGLYCEKNCGECPLIRTDEQN